MVKLLCHCLNVRIHVKGSLPLEPISIQDLSLDDDCSQEDFFASQLAQVQLDLEGFSLVSASLALGHSQRGVWVRVQHMLQNIIP